MKKQRKLLLSKSGLTLLFLLAVLFAHGQGAHPGVDPTGGLSTPLDGGILMALLGVFGIIVTLVKKKKKD